MSQGLIVIFAILIEDLRVQLVDSPKLLLVEITVFLNGFLVCYAGFLKFLQRLKPVAP